MPKYQDSEGERVNAAHVGMAVAPFNSQGLILRPLPLPGERRMLPNPGVISIWSKCEEKCRHQHPVENPGKASFPERQFVRERSL